MKNNIGRKLFDGKNPEAVVQKLEQVFAFGGTDKEAYNYAEISKSAFYEYQKRHPEFLDKKQKLSALLVLKARKAIYDNLDNPKIAIQYLKKVRPEEFGNKKKRATESEQVFYFSDR